MMLVLRGFPGVLVSVSTRAQLAMRSPLVACSKQGIVALVCAAFIGCTLSVVCTTGHCMDRDTSSPSFSRNSR